ncbi:MAG: tetratricopeptide repeat protein [Acidobacteria bacterium]|nr:tetratricopeptide repeat protein [Acidobacteriota bacterium]
MKLLKLSMLWTVFAVAASAQNIAKVADETFDYIKSGTFSKPKVAKNTTKMSLGQVRVHYKLITSQATAKSGSSAEVTVYLDSDLTERDLQNLTDEFYVILRNKLSAAGISAGTYDEVKATEYYAERQKTQEDKKLNDYDGKNGQAWISFTAYDGPVMVRWRPFGTTELIGFGKIKKMANAAETTGGDLATFDVVLDFASIQLKAGFRQDRAGWLYDNGKYTADYAIGALMNVPDSFVFLIDKKNNVEQFRSALPVAARGLFAEKPYEDASKTSLKTRQLLGDARFTFTPLVISSKRELYLNAAREMLTLYADMFVEKMRVIRGSSTPANSNSAQKPVDNTTIQQVNEAARNNNEPTPVTTGELEAAAGDAAKAGKFKLAVDYYTELIKKEPGEAKWYLGRGAVYLNDLGDLKAAIKDFDQGIKLAPNEPVFYYNRGTAYVKQEEWKKAKADFDKHISLNPNFAESYLNRGITFIYLKNLDAALADFNRGIQVNPRLPNLYRARALVYKSQGNAALAQADEIRAAQLEQ